MQVAGVAAGGRVEETVAALLDEFYLVVQDLLPPLLARWEFEHPLIKLFNIRVTPQTNLNGNAMGA